jgi:hypothetical protein
MWIGGILPIDPRNLVQRARTVDGIKSLENIPDGP